MQSVSNLEYYEAHITAVCNIKNIDLVKSLGAERVFDYTKEDFTSDDFEIIGEALHRLSRIEEVTLAKKIPEFCGWPCRI